MAELIGISYSPWSEKAIWALDHHKLEYTYREHVPMLGEPWLRWKTGQWKGNATVPLYCAGDQVIMDSLAIARYADQHGEGTSLFPVGAEDSIESWNRCSEEAMQAWRALTVGRMLEHPTAPRESLPPQIPAFLHPWMGPVAIWGLRFLQKKYDLTAQPLAVHRERLRGAFLRLQKRLQEGQGYLWEQFSYADLTMAVAVQSIAPRRSLPPSMRECWIDEALAEEFADVIEWRNLLYKNHRPPRRSKSQ